VKNLFTYIQPHVHVRIVGYKLKVSRSRHVCTCLLTGTISQTMRRNVYDLHIPFFKIQNKLQWHIYRLLRDCRVSEMLPKIPLFAPSLIHLGSQQHPQSGVLLTSFSTWVTENSLAEINLESTGVIKGCNIFWVKNWQTLAALWAGALSCNKKKSREQNAAGRTR